MSSFRSLLRLIITTVLMLIILASSFSYANANTQACIDTANQLSEELRTIFETHGQPAQQFYTLNQSWGNWAQDNNPIIEGDIEYSYGVAMFRSNNGWVVNERAFNLVQETLVEDEFRQADNDQLPGRFTFPEGQLDQWYAIVDQDPEWANAVDNRIADANILKFNCEIVLTVENVMDNTPFELTSGSSEEQPSQQSNVNETVPEGESQEGGEENPSEEEEGNNENEEETGSENNENQEQGSGSNQESIFGGADLELEPNSAIFNVPAISWNDQLAFQLQAETTDIEIFGVSVQDLQNGTADLNDFSIENPENLNFNFLNNINITDIMNGNIFTGDVELPGVEIDNIEFYYDFYYQIDALVDMNGRSYDLVELYFGRYPNNLSEKIIEYSDVSGTLTISEQIFNSRNGNQDQEHSVNLLVGDSHYVGIYGSNFDEDGNRSQDTIAIKRLHPYVDRLDDIGRIVTNWSPGPYMQQNGTNITFDLAGSVLVQNQNRGAADLRFGSGTYNFEAIQKYPAPVSQLASQGFSFDGSLQNYYVDVDTFDVFPIEPDTMYYAGIYERNQVVYFMQVGRTPRLVNPELQNEESSETESEEEEEGSMFSNEDPFSEFAQELEGGIVPCDGLSEECGYNEALELVQRGMTFVFIAIIPIAAIAFAYAGFLLLFQGSSPDKRKKARDIFIKVFIGIVIVLAAWLIVKTILTSLGVNENLILLDLSS